MGNLTRPRDLRDMMVEQGIQFASASEIGGWIGCSADEVAARLRGARQAREMVCVTNRGWVPALNNRISVNAFLGPMMRHIGHDYYLTGVSAAASYGASHQAAFTTQVATDGHLRSRVIAGMSRIAMLHNPETACVARTSRAVRSWTGHLCQVDVAVPEVVLFDLVAHCPYRAGDSKLNIFCEFIDPGSHLPPLVDPERLAETALLYRVADRQRVGFLMQEMSDHVGRPFDPGPLAATLPATLRTVELERAPDRTEPHIALDPRWRVRQWYEMWPDV